MQGVLNHLPQVRLVDNLDGGLSYRKPHANFVMSRRQDQICSKGRGLLSQLRFHQGHIAMSSAKIPSCFVLLNMMIYASQHISTKGAWHLEILRERSFVVGSPPCRAQWFGALIHIKQGNDNLFRSQIYYVF